VLLCDYLSKVDPVLHKMTNDSFLPGPVGKYNVGYVDIMTEGVPTQSSFIRLYYPTNQKTDSLPERCPKWTNNDSKYGLISFAHGLVKKWPSWVNPMEIRLIEAAKRSDYFFSWAFSPIVGLGWDILANNPRIPVIHQAQPLNQRFPVVVFSHGLGCNRYTYSKICYDLCSEGLFVAAVEHRDGSASFSRYMTSGESYEIEHLKLNGKETLEEEYLIRNQQILQRKNEVSRGLDLLVRLNAGVNIDNCLEREKGFNFSVFEGRMLLDDCYMMGHSFGGATALLAASDDDRFKGVVTMDPWMFPARNLNFSVEQPVLMINTEMFLHKSNIKKAKEVCKDLSGRLLEGAVHLVHTDAPLLFDYECIKGELGMRCSKSSEQVLSENHVILHEWIQSLVEGTQLERRYDWGVDTD